MSEIQDKLKVAAETAVIAGEESGLAVKGFFSSMAKWQKIVFFVGLLLIVPAYYGAYYASHYFVKSGYEDNLIKAHTAHIETRKVVVTDVVILPVAPNQYTAYFQATNPNLDLGAVNIPYTVNFYNEKNEQINTATGTFYLIPDQKKYVVVSRIDSTEELSKAELIVGDAKWQKKPSLPKVEFKTPRPEVYDLDITTVPQLTVEGSVVNDSEYKIRRTNIVFLVYGNTNKIVGINIREERDIVAFGRRAYKQTWPNLSSTEISKVEVLVDINTMDQSNLEFSSNQSVPVSDIPDLR